ncbi:GIY-YIG nuclease family protein [Nitrosomonas sp.]|uniref:GIY-YIG nuclease family protein n=1 Tax=Nitrosomonas sp. TaxID=42353 RepID=UPI0025D1FF19|nr:GIY-YIG nuclease family protein [Nitrosomonas sp.]
MAFGRKVTIYLADGAPSGIRHVEIANWSGQAIACPRSRLNELRQWNEAQRPGVYFLLEKQTADTGDRAYIGESENVVKRLSQQDKNQDFWNEVIVFTSKDENLTKAHIKYLESRLTAISIEADRYKIENGNTPTESTLPRADKDAMEEFVHNLRIVLGTLGHRVLEPVKAPTVAVTKVGDPPALSQFEFTFSIRGLHARGQQTDDGFVLFKDSDISGKVSKSMPGKTVAIREKWLAEGIMVPNGDNFRLTKDSILSSSSYAAVLVAGTSRSGPQSWIDEHGRSLKSVEEILLAET